ncbi:MAG: SDR family NAD(P)-dependent oxidoreductase [Chitinophagales bacterium]
MEKFTDKVALIIGAANGIGKATAIEFAKRGAKVIIADSFTSNKTLDYINSYNGEAIYMPSELSLKYNIKMLMEKCVSEFGKIDYAVNYPSFENTIISPRKNKKDNAEVMISDSIKYIWMCMKYELPYMLKRGGGSIVNCSSVVGSIELNFLAEYAVLKYKTISLSKPKLNINQFNVRINAISSEIMKRGNAITAGKIEASRHKSKTRIISKKVFQLFANKCIDKPTSTGVLKSELGNLTMI